MEKIDTWCERGILGLVLGILIYSPLATGAVRPQDFVWVQWMMVLTLAVWLVRFWVNPKHRLLWPYLSWGVLAFMIYAVIRYFTSPIEFVARQELIRVLVYGFLFFVVIHNLHRQETTHLLGNVLLFLGMAIALYAIIQFLTDSNKVWHFIKPEIYRKRGSGTFICPNNMAGYLEMLLPLGLVYTLTGRMNHVNKVFVGYAALVIFTGIVVSVSRGGWLAAGVSLLVLFYWLLRQRDFRLQAIMVGAALLAICGTFVLKAELSNNRKSSFSQMDQVRVRVWKSAVAMWKDNFWFGAGPGHFDHRFPQYRVLGDYPDQMQVRPERVHNDYLNTLADWGLAGALILVAVWGLFYGEVFRSWRYVQRSQNDLTSKRSNKTAFVLGGALGLVAMLVHSLVDFNMHIPANALLATTLLALVAGHFRFGTERHWHTVHAPLRLIITVILLTATVYLGWQAWVRTRESYWLGKSQEGVTSSEQQVKVLGRAFAVESKNSETAYTIGEALRTQSWQGGEDYQEKAQLAMTWFQRAMDLNRYDPYPPLRYGMCLDWIGKFTEAEKYFHRAAELDPNSYYTLAHVGWHYIQAADWKAAKKWLDKSGKIYWVSNRIALSYMDYVNHKLAESQP